MLKAVTPPCVSAAVAGAVSLAAAFWFGGSLSSLQRLVMESTVLLFAYSGMLLYVMGQKAFYFDLLRDLRGLSGETPVVGAGVVVAEQ
jgi:high-affinity Fe2+/Pb2+ permease